jgi:hypothetical protein
MSDKPAAAMTPQEIQAYRDGVEALVEACLERIRTYPLEVQVEPKAPEQPES